MKQLKDVVLLEIDKPTSSGNIYNRNTVLDILDIWNDKFKGGMFSVFDNNKPLMRALTIDIGNISHKVINIRLIDSKLLVDIDILDTPNGKNLEKLVELNTGYFALDLTIEHSNSKEISTVLDIINCSYWD